MFPASDVTSDGLARCSTILFDDVLLGSDIIILRPVNIYENIEINSNYLSFIINQQRKQLLSITTGSNVKHLSSNSLKNIMIPLPPLTIQLKVVEECKKLLEEFEINKKMDIESYRKGISDIFKKYDVIID